MKDQVIAQHMIRFPHCGSPEMSISEALEVLKKRQIRHLPILDGKTLVGLTSERDLKAAAALERSNLLTVADVMKKDVFVVAEDAFLSDIALKMADDKLGSAVVLNEDNVVVGIFTTTDALYLLADELEGATLKNFFGLRTQGWAEAYT